MLGPGKQEDPLQDPDAEPNVEWSPPRVTSAPSPAFKPSYTKPQLGPECSAKRKLDMSGGDASGLPPTAMEKEKIRSLGDPYATNKVPEAQSETGQDPPFKLLSPEVSAPFFAAAMLDAGIPVHFPPDEGAEAGELGEAEKARVRKPIRPWIPMTQSLQGYVRELQQAGRPPPRKTWIAKSFPASPEAAAEFFTPPLIPPNGGRSELLVKAGQGTPAGRRRWSPINQTSATSQGLQMERTSGPGVEGTRTNGQRRPPSEQLLSIGFRSPD